MADYIRRIVSGNKARFKDAKLDMELDLVYVTDRVIIMGYPASGIEGFYRNRREDAKKFLEHRHGKNYWIFNFCPLKENSYDPKLFDGRVSRYPFPDHHAPPLAIIPLAVREMNAWLQGSPDRVIVLHCKAGKGRSGTMACSYLLSISNIASSPHLDSSLGAQERAQAQADDTVKAIAEGIQGQSSGEEPASRITPPIGRGSVELESPTSVTPTSTNAGNGKSYADSLKDVLDLHTSRRMKAPSSSSDKIKQGVSIPSQRRWLYYWALLLAHETPPYFWAILPTPSEAQKPKVRLTQITLRMRETSGVKMSIVRAANTMIDRKNGGKSTARSKATNRHEPVWVSLARYGDEFVDHLEEWEKHTRDIGDDDGLGRIGRRKPGSDHMNGDELNRLFDDAGKWDKGKMVRSFAKLGLVDGDSIIKGEDEKEKHIIYKLRPLSNAGWKNIQEEVQQEDVQNSHPTSEANSLFEETPGVTELDIVLDAEREVRVKLYMGQIFMGWLWFIPTFHPTERLVFTRKEIDFPLGIGSGIIDMEISLEWLGEKSSDDAQPPARVGSKDSGVQGGAVPAGIAATMQATTAGGISQAIEANQAVED